MRNRIYWLVAILLILSMALVACGADEEPEAPVETASEEQAVDSQEADADAGDGGEEDVEAPAEEPTKVAEEEVVEEPPAFSEADLGAAYNSFLGSMVKYNTTGLDALNEALAGDPPPFLLDVRQPEELE